MKEKILEVLKLTRNNAIDLETIFRKIGYDKSQWDEFLDTMDELSVERKIYCTNSKNNLYTLNPFVEGIVHTRRNGSIYVKTPLYEIDITNTNNNYCNDGDKVLVRITDFNTFTGSIKNIIERCGIVAEVKVIDKEKYAVVGNEKYKIDSNVKLVDGMMVGIKLDKNKSGKYYRANVLKVFGHKNAPRLDEREILFEAGFNDEFSDEYKKALEYIPEKVLEEELVGRRDLRDKMIFTIDGDDTKDIDDAISLEILPNGNYLLGVHIANVSHYVKENSVIDIEARDRGTSVYMPGVVNPMYDPWLSNGICSLNPDVDRLAISCEMEIGKNGKILSSDIFRSVIHSRKQMTYKNVNKILEEGEVPEGYEEFESTLRSMNELSKILQKYRSDRGMLDFESSEIKINVDEQGKVLDIQKRHQGTGEKLIEMFMLAANEAVASYIYNMGLNSIYRVHEYPNEEKLKGALNIIKGYGDSVKTKIDISDPKVIQKLLLDIKNLNNYDIYSNMILRCMAKASYKVQNLGHFGIGISPDRREAYTHFTSPIRRYPDTTIHRILDLIFDGNIEKLESEEYRYVLNDIAEHSSEMELLADKCEREANKMKMAEYISDYIDQEFNGRIISFTPTGMFVELPNFVEGRVGYNTMDDYYNYSPEAEMIVGERTKKVYRLGDSIKVKVVRASKEAREIDFEMVTDKPKMRERHGNN